MRPISHCFVVILAYLLMAFEAAFSCYFSTHGKSRLRSFADRRAVWKLPESSSIPRLGAVVDFWGVVRGIEDEREIDGIEYEAHRADGGASVESDGARERGDF